jgi:hypothetical protein
MLFRRGRRLNKNNCWYMYGEKIEVVNGSGRNIRLVVMQIRPW